MNYGAVALSAERRRSLLHDAVREARAGDLLFFYHRTSWRSRWIRRITGCDLPHVCVYLGRGRILGMLRGRVRRHPLRRFFRDEYDLRFVRGSAAVLEQARRFLGKREAWLDLFVLGVLLLCERIVGTGRARRAVRYRMRGVTCSGLVSSAWHAAYGLSSRCDPLQHTPRDLEQIAGKVSFFEASLVPAHEPATITDRVGHTRDSANA